MIGEVYEGALAGLGQVEVEHADGRSAPLRTARRIGPWFRWAYVGVDTIRDVAGGAGFTVPETWTAGGRWFVASI